MMKAAFLWFPLLLMLMDCGEATVFVSVAPNSLQFFKYNHLSVSCEGEEEMAGWRVMQRKKNGYVKAFPALLSVSAAFPDIHSGVYWCETELGANSSSIIISVTSGSVILESPALPVTEGDSVTLNCRCENPGATEFYRNNLLIRTSVTGDTTIHGVSASDQGHYKCRVSGSGESPESWLAVREPSPSHQDPAPPLLSVSTLVRHLIVGAPYLLSTIILGLIHRDQREQQAVQVRRRRDKVTMQKTT